MAYFVHRPIGKNPEMTLERIIRIDLTPQPETPQSSLRALQRYLGNQAIGSALADRPHSPPRGRIQAHPLGNTDVSCAPVRRLIAADPEKRSSMTLSGGPASTADLQPRKSRTSFHSQSRFKPLIWKQSREMSQPPPAQFNRIVSDVPNGFGPWERGAFSRHCGYNP